ncbi:YihY/virulence factor BrkB family protein [Hufsiella ginkgonis]|uniref:YihY/virulence factor BrkB family protein n=1 Tax=Hufsiella ginkgonis TaxID=2695274 RepID=A0A7K1XS45_9SPHI|nr:YihY/virulence factor BrkB family protein [Hufsiella ginkgonis]MXV13805.1 hypothetical protein [Hufsiella ginkgonis]
MKQRKTLIRQFFRAIRGACAIFAEADPLCMAAATAFFTTFALPPILIVISRSVGFLYTGNIHRQIFSRLSQTIGVSSTRQVIDTLRAFRDLASSWYIGLLVIVLLTFVATNLFRIIQDSIHELWKISVIRKLSWKEKLMVRWRGVLVIMVTSFLFSAALVAEAVQSYLGEITRQMLPWVADYLDGVLNNVFSIAVTGAWFALLFRMLPAEKLGWPTVIAGGLFTGALFTAGKFVLRILLIQSNVNMLFGTGAAFVLLLLFMFYTSLILYFGAAFTKAWAEAAKPG